MASIKKINERKFKITISNGYRADGRKIRKTKTITVPDAVPRKQIEQYVNHAAVELERVFKIGYAEYGEMSFEEYSLHWLSRQLKYSQGTRESYRRSLEKVYPYIGDIAIAKLRPLALENMLAEKNSASTYSRTSTASSFIPTRSQRRSAKYMTASVCRTNFIFTHCGIIM